MRKLTEKSTQDAAAVRVLTMITLIYLPTTVVLVSRPNFPLLISCLLTKRQNFFSTQFVGQEQADSGAKTLVVTSNAWLFAAISVPLTFGTLLVWWLWVQVQSRQLLPIIKSIRSLSLQTLLTSPPHRRKYQENNPEIALEP